jgi:hypothetical protein
VRCSVPTALRFMCITFEGFGNEVRRARCMPSHPTNLQQRLKESREIPQTMVQIADCFLKRVLHVLRQGR